MPGNILNPARSCCFTVKRVKTLVVAHSPFGIWLYHQLERYKSFRGSLAEFLQLACIDVNAPTMSSAQQSGLNVTLALARDDEADIPAAIELDALHKVCQGANGPQQRFGRFSGSLMLSRWQTCGCRTFEGRRADPQ